MNAIAAEADSAGFHQKKLLKVASKRLERFVTLVPKVLVSDDADPIHDLRVASRRLQQALRALPPTAKLAKDKKIIRVLRQVRQALGPCRNLDVNIALIKEKRRHGGAGVIQRAWDAIESDLDEKRQPLLKRARRSLAQHDVFAFIERVKTLIEGVDPEADPVAPLDEATTESMTKWEEIFTAAYGQRDETSLHALRIASKRLRYRAELLAELGQNNAKPLVDDLKKLQQSLGDWHDRWVLLRQVAEFVGRADFVAEHPDLCRILLAEMEKEKQRSESIIDQLFSGAAKVRQNWARRKPVRDEAAEKVENAD